MFIELMDGSGDPLHGLAVSVSPSGRNARQKVVAKLVGQASMWMV